MSGDSRGGLADAPFRYRATADGRVLISWRERQVAVLRGRQATRFLARVADADPGARQQAMARATGNFRRGNERG